MAITVYPEKIQFTNYSLNIDENGLKVSGNGIFSAAVLQIAGGRFGTVSGYSSGGATSAAPSYSNIIDKFPFASDANATDVGDLTRGVYTSSGQSSAVAGYTSAGYSPAPPSGNDSIIDKFPFATNANASNIGGLTVARRGPAGQMSDVSGYASGGSDNSGAYATLVTYNTIDRFSFATNGNATDVGDLSVARTNLGGQSSSVSGYTSGGMGPAPVYVQYNIIDKFPFATNTNASDVGDLTVSRYATAAQSSSVSGYISGGTSGSGGLNVIDKFPFATNANATDVGDLTQGRYGPAGQSSFVSGYSSGGTLPAGSRSNIIDKFPFATDGNATDVGDLTVARTAPAGQQN